MDRSGRVVIVGASLAGARAAEGLRREGFEGPMTIVGAESHRPYDRPPLSKKVLAGKMEQAEAALRLDDAVDAEWRLSTRATGLDLERRVVNVSSSHSGSTSDSDELRFDGLVIATGAHPRMLPDLPDLEGVHILRTIDHCLALREELERSPRVAVVGAGFIGSEVAATCRGRGLEVTVIEALPVPLARAVGEELGRRCARLHEDNGVSLRLGVGVTGLTGTSRVEGVRMADDSVVPADLVVIGVGVAPTTGWLESSGLDLHDGVVCDQWCRALSGGQPVADVVAAGDVARWDHPSIEGTLRLEHWTNAIEQGNAAARSLLLGSDAPPFAPVPYFWSDQYDTKIQFVGQPGPDVEVVDGALEDARFTVAYGRDGRLVGALSFNQPRQIMRHRAMIANGGEFPPRPKESAAPEGGR